MIKQHITRKLLITFFISTTAFSNAFAFCSGTFGDPYYEACRQQEELNHTQKQMLELQRQQMEQQRQDNIMRNAEESFGYRRWN